MNIIIRKIKDTKNEYFAYMKLPLATKATYLLYFMDNIHGAVCLVNFIEMLKNYYNANKVNLDFNEEEITIKNDMILQVLKK